MPQKIFPKRCAGALFLLLLFCAPKVHAQNFSGWKPVFQGIDYDEGTAYASNVFAMRIDLRKPGIKFETTPVSPAAKAEGYETESQSTSGFLIGTGAQVAINANFFSNVSSRVQHEHLFGLAVSEGVVVSPAKNGFQSLIITADNHASIAEVHPGSKTEGIWNAASGVQNLVNGVAVTPHTGAGDPTGLDPRTDAGVSRDGRYLYLVVVDGRSSKSKGVTDLQAGQLLLALGAYNGINLDGGGSTNLVKSDGKGGATILNVPSKGGKERLDGNSFAVFALPLSR